MPIKAYSYRRFSSPQQGQGHSLERQLEMSKAYAEEKGYELDTELVMADEGVSAFKSANVTEGNLGAFIAAIHAGKVEAGSYLLVESLDRLSRDRVVAALRRFLEILESGIIIVTLIDRNVYDEKNLDSQQLMLSIFIMSRAHEESLTKSIRQKKVWSNKRQNAQVRKLTKWAPKWLYLSDDRAEFIPHEDRVEVIGKIFKWCVAGFGTSQIVKKLEREGVEPWDWGESGMEDINVPKRWHGSYVQKLIHNRSLLGEYRYTDPSSPKVEHVIEDYFPKVISEELFYKAHSARKARDVNRGGVGAGRKGELLSNLFSGITYCGYSFDTSNHSYRCEGDAEKMVYTNKGKKYRYLQCSRVKAGNTGCEDCTKMWRYDFFEKSFCTFINDIDLTDIAGLHASKGLEIQRLKSDILVLEGRWHEAKKQVNKYAEAMDEAETIPILMTEKLVEFEALLQELEEKLKGGKKQLREAELEFEGKDASAENMVAILNQMKQLDGESLFDARVQLSNAIRKFIDRVILFPSGYNLERTEVDYQRFNEMVEELAGTEVAEEALNELRQLYEQSGDRNRDPFFLVEYKSGKQMIVTPDPKDPARLIASVAVDEAGEENYAVGGIELVGFNPQSRSS